jgi:hypothetical protein
MEFKGIRTTVCYQQQTESRQTRPNRTRPTQPNLLAITLSPIPIPVVMDSQQMTRDTREPRVDIYRLFTSHRYQAQEQPHMPKQSPHDPHGYMFCLDIPLSLIPHPPSLSRIPLFSDQKSRGRVRLGLCFDMVSYPLRPNSTAWRGDYTKYKPEYLHTHIPTYVLSVDAYPRSKGIISYHTIPYHMLSPSARGRRLERIHGL